VRIAVYTSITGSKDTVKEPQSTNGADFLLFTDCTDQDRMASTCWQTRPACKLFVDPRRNSRAPKLLAHQYVPDYDYSLWIDGSIRLLLAAPQLVQMCLGDADMVLFRHPTRDCLYDEADVCSISHRDDPAVIADQAKKYRSRKFPPKSGLNECGVILRRHNEAVERFNNAWWSEYCRHSCRDQLSFNYVINTLGIKLVYFPGTRYANPGIVAFEGHAS
jgi:alkaline ceramidase TOD1/glycosyltransferase MUCI70-like protein